jgi:hypothetical protein
MREYRKATERFDPGDFEFGERVGVEDSSA